MSVLPAQFQPPSIERFGSIFYQVNASYPSVIQVRYAPLAFDTFTCRFRDAVRGIMIHNQCPHYREVVKSWADDFTVARDKSDPSMVLIGSSAEVKQFNKQTRSVGTVIDASINLTEVSSPSEKVLIAILTLLNYNLLPDVTLRGANMETVLRLIPIHSPDRPLECLESGDNIILL